MKAKMEERSAPENPVGCALPFRICRRCATNMLYKNRQITLNFCILLAFVLHFFCNAFFVVVISILQPLQCPPAQLA